MFHLICMAGNGRRTWMSEIQTFCSGSQTLHIDVGWFITGERPQGDVCRECEKVALRRGAEGLDPANFYLAAPQEQPEAFCM